MTLGWARETTYTSAHIMSWAAAIEREVLQQNRVGAEPTFYLIPLCAARKSGFFLKLSRGDRRARNYGLAVDLLGRHFHPEDSDAALDRESEGAATTGAPGGRALLFVQEFEEFLHALERLPSRLLA